MNRDRIVSNSEVLLRRGAIGFAKFHLWRPLSRIASTLPLPVLIGGAVLLAWLSPHIAFMTLPLVFLARRQPNFHGPAKPAPNADEADGSLEKSVGNMVGYKLPETATDYLTNPPPASFIDPDSEHLRPRFGRQP